jgi:hypothetical protein
VGLKCQGCFEAQVFHFFNQQEPLVIVQFVIVEWHLGRPTEETSGLPMGFDGIGCDELPDLVYDGR